VIEMRFSHPLLVLPALELVKREPLSSEIPDVLRVSVDELIVGRLAAQRVVRHGRGVCLRVFLTPAGVARLRAAHEVAAAPC
jgi:hypothetical protein